MKNEPTTTQDRVIRTYQQGDTPDVMTSFNIRLNPENAKTLEQGLANPNLHERIFVHAYFKDPESGSVKQLKATLEKVNGEFMLTNTGYAYRPEESPNQVMPTRTDQIVGVNLVTLVDNRDVEIPIFKKVDSFQTALEEARQQPVRIYYSKHDSEDFFIQGIVRDGIVSAVLLDSIGNQQEVSLKISGGKCIFNPNSPDDEYSKPIISICQLGCHVDLKATNPAQGIVPTQIPIIDNRAKEIDTLSSLKLIAVGSDLEIQVKQATIFGRSEVIELKRKFLGLENDHLIVGNPQAHSDIDRFPLKDIVGLKTVTPSYFDQKNVEVLLEPPTAEERSRPGQYVVHLGGLPSRKNFDVRERKTLFSAPKS